MDFFFIALLTTHAWAALQSFTMASKRKHGINDFISKNRIVEYKGRKRGEAGFKTNTYIKYQYNTLLS